MDKKVSQQPDSCKSLLQESERSKATVRKSKLWGEGSLNVLNERRACIRHSSNMQARFFYGDMVYEGLITDISEKGMFISTDIIFSPSQMLDIMLIINKKVLKIPVTIKRSVKQDSTGFSGVGVELLRVPQKYLDHVSGQMSS